MNPEGFWQMPRLWWRERWLLVGFVDTFGKVFFAEYSGIGVYLLMAVILVWRPEGLMKRGH